MSEQIRLHERVATLESTTSTLKNVTDSHSEHLATLDRTLTALVGEVKQIRNAMYAIAAMLSYGPGRDIISGFITAWLKK